jgi:hypothetical protein
MVWPGGLRRPRWGDGGWRGRSGRKAYLAAFHAPRGVHAGGEGHRDERQRTPQRALPVAGPGVGDLGQSLTQGYAPPLPYEPHIGQVCPSPSEGPGQGGSW